MNGKIIVNCIIIALILSSCVVFNKQNLKYTVLLKADKHTYMEKPIHVSWGSVFIYMSARTMYIIHSDTSMSFQILNPKPYNSIRMSGIMVDKEKMFYKFDLRGRFMMLNKVTLQYNNWRYITSSNRYIFYEYIKKL